MTERQNLQVLLITYYWPPSGGSGVQRWLKFVKYLPEFDVNTIVFTPENPQVDLRDDALLNDLTTATEVLFFPIWEPYRVFKKIKALFFPAKKSDPGFTFKREGLIAKWIRGNFFIPDPRIFWVRPSVRFLNDFIKSRNIQKVITTGPPHSVHLIGLRLKEKNPGLKWIADFRDPWTDWGALKEFHISYPVMQIHHYLEKKVFKSADGIITISPFYVNKFKGRTNKQVNLITNGFDAADFNSFKVSNTEKFILRHVGIVHPSCDMIPFLSVCKSWIMDQKIAAQVEIRFTGIVHDKLKAWIRQDPFFDDIIYFEDPVSHNEILQKYAHASALLLILTGYQDAEGFLPGKMFEYIATGLPIIGTGPEASDAQSVLVKTHSGILYHELDSAGIMSGLSKIFYKWKNGEQFEKRSDLVLPYERKHITRELAEILKAQ